MEHYIVIAVYEATGIGFIADATFALGIAVTQLKTGSLIGNTPVKEEEKGITPVHMGTIQPEQILSLFHSVDEIRQVGYTSACLLRQKNLMPARFQNIGNVGIERTLGFIKERCSNVYFQRFNLLKLSRHIVSRNDRERQAEIE